MFYGVRGGNLRVWKFDGNKGKYIHKMVLKDGHKDDVLSLVYVPERKILISGCYDGSIIIWVTTDKK